MLTRLSLFPFFDSNRRMVADRQPMEVVVIVFYNDGAGWNLDIRIQTEVKLALDEVQVVAAFGLQPVEEHETARDGLRLSTAQGGEHSLARGHEVFL
jgi:hypothetical protein